MLMARICSNCLRDELYCEGEKGRNIETHVLNRLQVCDDKCGVCGGSSTQIKIDHWSDNYFKRHQINHYHLLIHKFTTICSTTYLHFTTMYTCFCRMHVLMHDFSAYVLYVCTLDNQHCTSNSKEEFPRKIKQM